MSARPSAQELQPQAQQQPSQQQPTTSTSPQAEELGSSSEMAQLEVTAGLELESNFTSGTHAGAVLFSTPTQVGDVPLATRPAQPPTSASFDTPQAAKHFLFGTPSNPVPPLDQTTYHGAVDPLADALVEGSFLRYNPGFNSTLQFPPVRQLAEVESSGSSDGNESDGVASGHVSSGDEARSTRSRSFSGESSQVVDIRQKLLEKMEKIQSMAGAVIKELREYMLISENSLRERAAAMYSNEPPESYTARLEFVVPPSDVEYCNKSIDPPVEVRLVDLQGTEILDRVVQLRVVLCDGESRPLDKTTTGGPLITGTAEATLSKGRAVFGNVRIMEVSSKHMNKCFHLVVEAKTRQGIQPVVSAAVRVFAKKLTTAPKQKRGDYSSSELPVDKRLKY